MQIVEDRELRALALDALRVEYHMAERRPGLHQSELAYCLSKTYWERTDPSPFTETEVLLFAIGFGMERVVLAREVQPEPLEIDGIHLSLDTIKLFGPADLKTTRKRAAGRKGEDGFQLSDGWVKQFKTYAYGIKVLEFGVVIIHLIEPALSAYRLHFTQEELDENWEWLLQRKATLDQMLAADDPQPFRHNEDWECDHCRYKLKCQLSASIRPSNVVDIRGGN